MDQELEKLTRKVARITEQKFIRDDGIHPFFYGIKDDETRFIFDPYRSSLLKDVEEYDARIKDAISRAAQILFAAHKVKRYVYASEAWALRTDDNITAEEIEAAMNAGGLSAHPKRVEVIVYQAEDINNNGIQGYQSIIRPAGQKPYLYDDLELNDTSKWESGGRFVKLLEFRKYYDEQQALKGSKR